MCTRFVYNGKDTITGFNFDIDLSVWDHKVMKEKDRFYIGIKMPDNRYHSFHGVHRNGNTRNKKSFMPRTQLCRPCFLTDMEESFS